MTELQNKSRKAFSRLNYFVLFRTNHTAIKEFEKSLFHHFTSNLECNSRTVKVYNYIMAITKLNSS